MSRLSKNAQILKYFAQQHPGIGRTKLQKLAYLSDLEARRHLGHPITDFDYVFYHHGPFDSSLYDAIDELCAQGLAREEQTVFTRGYVKKSLVDAGEPVPFEFSAGERKVLSYISRNYLRTDLDDLLTEIVYETEPMKAVERKNERLPMEEQDDTATEHLGFSLERVAEAERKIQNGNYELASDFFDGLRDPALS